MLSIWSSFADLPDPRTGNAQRHNLPGVLTIALTATNRGAESRVEFADFAREREALFRDVLELPGDKESEIIAARALLGLLDPQGARVTGDAPHRQRGTAKLIQERGGDRLFTLKANRPVPHKEAAAWFADPQARPEPEHTTTDADHGRIEVRRHVVSHDIGWMLSDRRHPDEATLPGLGMIGMLEATVTRDGRASTERRYYLSSARMDAERFAAAARSRWRIENSRQCVLDVAFDEDRARTRRDHGPANLATLRKRALNVLQAARPGNSIRRKRKRSGWSDEFARSVLGHMR